MSAMTLTTDAELLAALDAQAQPLATQAAQRIRDLLVELGQAKASLSTTEWFKRTTQKLAPSSAPPHA